MKNSKYSNSVIKQNKTPTSKLSASTDNLSNSNRSRASHLVDTAVQTVDINGDRFLDNAIIRYPSTHILKSLSSSIVCTCSDYNCSTTGSQNPENTRNSCIEDIGDSNRNQFIENLREFRDTGAITKKKSEPPYEGYRGPRAPQSVRSHNQHSRCEINPETISQNNLDQNSEHSGANQSQQPPHTACSIHSHTRSENVPQTPCSIHSHPPSEPNPQTPCSLHSANNISPSSIQSHDTQTTTKSRTFNKSEVPAGKFFV